MMESRVCYIDRSVRTECFDNMAPVDEDPRWEAFGRFQEYLLEAFPKVYVYLIHYEVSIQC